MPAPRSRDRALPRSLLLIGKRPQQTLRPGQSPDHLEGSVPASVLVLTCISPAEEQGPSKDCCYCCCRCCCAGPRGSSTHVTPQSRSRRPRRRLFVTRYGAASVVAAAALHPLHDKVLAVLDDLLWRLVLLQDGPPARTIQAVGSH